VEIVLGADKEELQTEAHIDEVRKLWRMRRGGQAFCKYSVIQKDGLNFVRLYFLNYKWYVNDLLTI
jgi:hypothetical protein